MTYKKKVLIKKPKKKMNEIRRCQDWYAKPSTWPTHKRTAWGALIFFYFMGWTTYYLS